MENIIVWIAILLLLGAGQVIVKIIRVLLGAGQQRPPGAHQGQRAQRDVGQELRDFLQQLNREFGGGAAPPQQRQRRPAQREAPRPRAGARRRPARRQPARRAMPQAPPGQREAFGELVGPKPLTQVDTSLEELRSRFEKAKGLVSEKELARRMRPASTEAARRRAFRRKVGPVRVGAVTPQRVREAIVWSEILGPPRALRPWTAWHRTQ